MSPQPSRRLDDPDRLAELARLGLVDPAPDEVFDRLTRLATTVLDAPLSLASFVTDERQVFKSCAGSLPAPFTGRRDTPLSHSFCQHVVRSGEPLVIEDARVHPLVSDNLAIPDLGVIAYAGIPILGPGGELLGSFCVIDTRPRAWTDGEVDIVRDLAASVNTEIALRSELIRQGELERALRRARDEAESATRAKSAFLANMSHEIRTPLSAILGYAELLLEDIITADQRRQALEAVQHSGQALLHIINDVLDLSRIESGKLELDPVPFAADGPAHEVIETLGLQARDRHLRLELVCEGEVPATIVADEARVRQVLMNLVANALKFTEEGGVRVRVSRPSSERVLYFSVSDTGIGIAPDRIDLIFGTFDQADPSTTRRYGGTGLGLAISRRLVELMGGSIGVKSVEGEGSEFWFTLPYDVDPEGGDSRDSDADDAPAAHPVDATILVVDDYEPNCELMQIALETRGYTVVVARSGPEALDLVAEHTFDLVLMDLQMPGMDGLEATRRLREAEAARGGRMPVVALTAHATEADREQCMEAGMDDFLTKPVRVTRLLEVVEAHLA